MNNVSERVSRNLQAIAEELDVALTEKAGEQVAFVLIVFTPERANYIGNGPRDQVRSQIKDLVGLWEAGMDDVPAHNVN